MDTALVSRGLARSRNRAAELIRAGRVRVDGSVVTRAAQRVNDDTRLMILGGADGYVGRGAGKLATALAAVPVSVAGRCAADIGACTGGFTQVLLAAGAARVFAVDVGHGQLAAELRDDPRVVNLEGVNARDVDGQTLPAPCGVIVADLSFISLTLVVPALAHIATPDADALLLIKPQFEAGREALDGTGVVRSATTRADAVVRVAQVAQTHGFTPQAVVPSGVPGAAGNREYVLWATRVAGAPAASMSDLHAVVLQDGHSTSPIPGEVGPREDRS